MEDVLLPQSWALDQVISDLHQHGFAVIDRAYEQAYLRDLVEECTENINRFREAGIQNGVVTQIRSDHILWINKNLPIAQQHINTLQQLAITLNRAFFTSIREVEAHFACYNAGEFYTLHRDNPQQKNDRVFSAVYYLHEQWQSHWGGQLRLQDVHQDWHIIEPAPNRLVIFQSDLLHEVLKAQQQRLSITAWLRSGPVLW